MSRVATIIRQSLDKPGLHPRAKKTLEKRLKMVEKQDQQIVSDSLKKAFKAREGLRGRIMSKILEWESQGENFVTISQRLNDEGLCRPTGIAFTARSVKDMLRYRKGYGKVPTVA